MSNDKMGATGYTPASDPWEALAAHGAPPPSDPDPAVDRMAYASPGPPPWDSQVHQDLAVQHGWPSPAEKRRGLPPWAVVSIVLGVVALLVAGGVVAGLTGESGRVPVIPAPAPRPAEVPTSGTCEKRIVGQYGLVATVTATNTSGKAQTGTLWARWPVTGEAAQEFTKRATLQPGQRVELTVNQEVTADRWFRTGACSFGWTPDGEGGVDGELMAGWNWTPTTTPVSRRTIEVVDQVRPSKWHVSAAVEWLDRYTASNMKTVRKCSGKAYRCITIRGGKLSGNALAMSYGSRNLIVVDTAKVDRRGYRSDTSRKKILAHEVAHQFGLGHSSGRNLMSTSLPRVKLYLTSGQRSHLKKR